MLLKCLIDHIYQDVHFTAGEVYEVEDASASRLLRDFGPDNSVETRRNRTPKFEPTTERPTNPDKPEGENVIDNTLPPEGEGAAATGARAVVGEPGELGELGETARGEPGDAEKCNYPVGNGFCVLPEGHGGAHRLTAPEGSA